MASKKYHAITLDLSVARSNAILVHPGERVYGLTVLTLAAGADARLRFGDTRADELAIREGDDFDPDRIGEPLEEEGIFLSNTAQPGLTLELYLPLIPAGAERR